MDQIISSLQQFWEFTGFCNMTWQHIVMIAIGIVFITLAIVKEWEPLLLVPIGFGMIIGNIPMFPGLNIGVYEDGSVLNILYQGVRQGWYPPLIFLGIGAMTDFSALISQPRLILIGAAAQMGIFGAYLLALSMGFMPNEAGAIGIIGGADGPTRFSFRPSSLRTLWVRLPCQLIPTWHLFRSSRSLSCFCSRPRRKGLSVCRLLAL